MLTARRSVHLQGRKIIETPLLVPSFSSKGFPGVRQLIDIMSEYITESTLLSAYDVHYGLINQRYSFCDIVFLDSGGYEASIDFDLSDARRLDLKPRNWQHSFYRSILRRLVFPKTASYVVINYDNPKSRIGLRAQVQRAKDDFAILSEGTFISEFLIKPERAPGPKKTDRTTYLDVDRIVRDISHFRDFDIVGVTEKELGRSLLERMSNIGRIRRALSDANMLQPIHVFGALDPISVPLYFFAGADIFDGLTWLRYAYHQGLAIYIANYAALSLSLDTHETSAGTRSLVSNLSALASLQRAMRTFAETHDFSVFTNHAGWLETAYKHFKSTQGGH